jgi:glycosyltransferase involved in cell wall biosynthesis
MHVTIVNYVLTVMRGGGETRDLAWASGLRSLGVDVRFMAIQPLFRPLKYQVEEFPVDLVRAPYLREHVYALMGRPRTGRLTSLLMDAETRIFCNRAIRALAAHTGPINIVHSSHLYPLTPVRRARKGVKVIVRNMGGMPRSYRRFIPEADAIIGDGSGALEFERTTGFPIHFVPGGVNANLFSPGSPPVRSSLGLEGRELILFVGRIAPLKNLPLLLDALAILRRRRPNAVVLVAGEGQGESAARAQAARLGIADAVHFAGHVRHGDLPAYYNAAHVFVLCSTFDNSPNALLEAMACQRPVIATRVGGVPLYVDHESTGLLVESGDAIGLAETIERVLEQRTEAEAMAARARQHVLSTFTWERSTQALFDVYQRVLGGQ